MKNSHIEMVREDCELVLKDGAKSLAPLKGETLTITGGTGFVGTWLTELIAHLNDHYSFGTRVILMARGVDAFKTTRAHLAGRKDVVLVKADIRYATEIPKETNWLIHAAANPDNRFHSLSPVEAMT